MADDNKIGWVLDLDNASFTKGMDESISKTEALTNTLTNVAKIGGVVTAAALAVKAAIDLTEEAEAVRAVAIQYDTLAQKAGIAGEKLKEGLLAASNNLIDDTDLMKAANRSMVEMGSNAARLPELMTVARKASALYGGDLLDRFESINQAIATGQVRGLKHMGLIIDQEKAYRNYAEKIGVATSTLSEHGRQQAVLEAVLAKSKSAFGEQAGYVKEATNTMQQLKVALASMGETATLAFERLAGGKVRQILTSLRDMSQDAKTQLNANFGEGSEKAAAQLEVLQNKIQSVKGQLIDAEQKKLGHVFDFNPGETASQLQTLPKVLKEYEAQLDATKVKVKEFKDEQDKADHPGGKTADQTKADSNQDDRKTKEADLAYFTELRALQQAVIAEQDKFNDTLEGADTIYEDQIRLINEAAAADIAKLQLSDTLNPEQKANQEILMEEVRVQKLKNLEDGLLAKRKNALNQYEEHSTGTADAISRSFHAGSMKASLEMNNFATTGRRVFQSFSSNAVGALQAWGAGQKSAGDAAKGFLFGMLADEAQARGTLMMLSSIWPPNPVGLAGGAALIALSGFLRSQSGGSGGGGAGAVSSSGAGSAGGPPQPGATSDSYGRPEPEQKIQQKSVSVVVQGSYFETEQTKRRLVEMIEEHSDATSYSVTSLGN